MNLPKACSSKNKKKMKNLIYLGIATIVLASIGFVSCEKKDLTNDQELTETNNSSENSGDFVEKAAWPPNINIDLPFEPIRLARAKSTPNHAGRICGCNECFGLCNRPIENGVAGVIAVQKISETKATLFILENFPSNFEEEFGVDEPVTFTNERSRYIIKPGLYNAVKEEGEAIDPNGNTHRYFVKVNVELL